MKKLFSVKLLVVIALVSVLIFTQVVISSADTPTQELFGHVTLVQGYAVPSYTGCHALIQLTNNQTIAVMTTDPGLQGELESALATGNLVACWAQLLTDPPCPLGGTWSLDVYNTNSIVLYNTK